MWVVALGLNDCELLENFLRQFKKAWADDRRGKSERADGSFLPRFSTQRTLSGTHSSRQDLSILNPSLARLVLVHSKRRLFSMSPSNFSIISTSFRD